MPVKTESASNNPDSLRFKISRRKFLGLATGASAIAILPKAEPAYSGGGTVESLTGGKRRALSDREIALTEVTSDQHEKYTAETIERFLKKSLRETYGYTVHPTDINEMKERRATNVPTEEHPYLPFSDVRLSSVEGAVDITSLSYFDGQGNFYQSNINVSIPQYGTRQYYIPEFNSLVTPRRQGDWLIEEQDMEKAMHLVYDLPEMHYTGDINERSGEINGKIWKGKTEDGHTVRVIVSKYRQISLEVESLSQPIPQPNTS